MTIQLDFNTGSTQSMLFITEEINVVDKYIEFIHEQSDFTTGNTFINTSSNDRYLQFDIIVSDYFIYSGWYSYYLYDDITKTTLIEKGKCNLQDSVISTTYERTSREKIIYNR